MKPEDPTDPQAWLLRAKSNLSLAEKGGRLKGVLLEDLCFNAQQAAEKGLKAVCLAKDLEFPRTHSVVRLVDILEAGEVSVPNTVREADVLTHYAVQSRYPGWAEEVTQEEYREALELAARVVFWAESVIA
jgi:HEPN domain-containing protein